MSVQKEGVARSPVRTSALGYIWRRWVVEAAERVIRRRERSGEVEVREASRWRACWPLAEVMTRRSEEDIARWDS